MPSTPLTNYLRTHRKRLSLSQEEVAFLLGTQNGGSGSLSITNGYSGMKLMTDGNNWFTY